MSVHQMVSLIMAPKPLNVIVGQPTTDTMNTNGGTNGSNGRPSQNLHVRRSPWIPSTCPQRRLLHHYHKGTVISTAPVAQPDAVNKKITATLTPLKILMLQEETKKILREFDLQEAVTNIGVQQIVNSIEKQYIKDSMKSTSGTPITPSMVSFIISKPTGVRS